MQKFILYSFGKGLNGRALGRSPSLLPPTTLILTWYIQDTQQDVLQL